MPLAPDGGMQPGAYRPAGGEGPPAYTEENCPCLRGPCRYLFETKQHFEHGNAPGTLSSQPIEFDRRCTAVPGLDIPLSADSPVLSCNRWDPMDPGEKAALEARRDAYRRRSEATLDLGEDELDEGIGRDVVLALRDNLPDKKPHPPFPSEFECIVSCWPTEFSGEEPIRWEWQVDLGHAVSADGCLSPWEAIAHALQQAKELHERSAEHANAS